jgi:hypothetical protein
MPGGTLDRWFYGALERSLRGHFSPEILEIGKSAREKKIALAAADEWLLQMITGSGVPGLYSPDKGIVRYVEGTSPEPCCYSRIALAPWLAMLGYRSYVTRRDDLRDVCARWVERMAEEVTKSPPTTEKMGLAFHHVLPLLRYLTCFPNDRLQAAVRQVLGRMLEGFPPADDENPRVALGPEVFHAEACLLAGQMFGDRQMTDAGLRWLERINAAAGEQCWRFGCEAGLQNARGSAAMRPLAYGHAILCNLMAYSRAGDERCMEMAGAFARYLISTCFATINDSTDLDFDTRGFVNAAPAGRDPLIECAVLESADSLRCVAYWLGFRPDNPAGFYDLLWMLSRTFCGVFPEARDQRIGYNTDGRRVRRANDDVPSAIAYRRFPYVAYENPIGQTRQSPRVSVEALQNYLTFGGALASCDNERLLVLAPRAAGFDLAERSGRLVHVYNPGEATEDTRLAIHHLSARRQFDVVVGNKRAATGLSGDALSDIAVQIPPHRTVVVEVAPSQQTTSSHF